MIPRLRALCIDLLTSQANALKDLEAAEELARQWRMVAEAQEANARGWRQRYELAASAVDPILLDEMLSTLADIDSLQEEAP